MSYPNQNRRPGLLYSKCVMDEKKSDDDEIEEPRISGLPSSEALSPVASTLASLSALKNIVVSKSAPHAIVPSASIVHNARNGHLPVVTSTNSTKLLGNKPQSKLSDQSVLRRGKWSPEEEEYANAVVREFNSGYLDAAAGTTLRIYLSEKLQCDPMRITKKFTGNESIGKRVFHPIGRIGDELTKEAREAQVCFLFAVPYHTTFHLYSVVTSADLSGKPRTFIPKMEE
jgi:hypothetical protein